MRQMLDYAQKAQAMVAGRQRADLDADFALQLALTRAIEVIGERLRGCPRGPGASIQTFLGETSWGCAIA